MKNLEMTRLESKDVWERSKGLRGVANFGHRKRLSLCIGLPSRFSLTGFDYNAKSEDVVTGPECKSFSYDHVKHPCLSHHTRPSPEWAESSNLRAYIPGKVEPRHILAKL